MKVKNLVKKFINLPQDTVVTILRDGFDKNLSREEALQCKRRVLFFMYYPSVFTEGCDEPHPELVLEIE